MLELWLDSCAVNYAMHKKWIKMVLTGLRVSSERFLHDLTKAVTIIPIPKIAKENPNALKKKFDHDK